MYIRITNIDAGTGILCTEAPMRTGPAFPNVKGFVFNWANESIYPIDCAPDGRYIEMPLYYGTCDDDADTSLVGVVSILTEAEFNQLKYDEYYARRPYPSWIWDADTLTWNPPVPYPKGAQPGEYYWDEATISWVKQY